MHAALLDDRGVIEVGGPEAGAFLQRLFTNDVLGLRHAEARYAALLTPQGKILADFLVVACGGTAEARFLIDCPRALSPDLARKLTMYRLRAKVTIAERGGEVGVAAFWPGRPEGAGVPYRDPRHEALGYRVAGAPADLARHVAASQAELYRATRIRAGVPEGGVDFAYGEAFPHEANLDRLHGLDFTKGCYVGQEVVSRVEHRGTARKRVTALAFEGPPPAPGTAVTAGEAVIGTMGSGVECHGLAMIRTDRADEALAAGGTIEAGGVPLRLAPP